MRHHHNGFAFRREILKKLKDRVRRARVEIARRFVGDDDGRIVGERARDGGALLLSARQRRR